MNLKEAFRYQTFLDNLLANVTALNLRAKSMKVIEVHKMSESNPEAENKEEVIQSEEKYTVDDVVNFLEVITKEKEKLSIAIGKAKESAEIDIDAAIAANKYRQTVSKILSTVLQKLPTNGVRNGTARKFNVEGNQTSYYYEIETSYEDNFDRKRTKELMKSMITYSDETSMLIDSAMINTKVDYAPLFDVNDSFDDIIEEFVK